MRRLPADHALRRRLDLGARSAGGGRSGDRDRQRDATARLPADSRIRSSGADRSGDRGGRAREGSAARGCGYGKSGESRLFVPRAGEVMSERLLRLAMWSALAASLLLTAASIRTKLPWVDEA